MRPLKLGIRVRDFWCALRKSLEPWCLLPPLGTKVSNPGACCRPWARQSPTLVLMAVLGQVSPGSPKDARNSYSLLCFGCFLGRPCLLPPLGAKVSNPGACCCPWAQKSRTLVLMAAPWAQKSRTLVLIAALGNKSLEPWCLLPTSGAKVSNPGACCPPQAQKSRTLVLMAAPWAQKSRTLVLIAALGHKSLEPWCLLPT